MNIKEKVILTAALALIAKHTKALAEQPTRRERIALEFVKLHYDDVRSLSDAKKAVAVAVKQADALIDELGKGTDDNSQDDSAEVLDQKVFTASMNDLFNSEEDSDDEVKVETLEIGVGFNNETGEYKYKGNVYAKPTDLLDVLEKEYGGEVAGKIAAAIAKRRRDNP